uniref:Uncharacterized protein n=1 Tax=Lotharella oceanica TaxID=641309 RepID=A0A7S2TID1_9EUKA
MREYPQPAAPVLGIYELGSVVVASGEEGKGAFVRITNPFPGWVEKDGLQPAARIRSIEAMLAASTAIPKVIGAGQKIFRDLRSYLCFWGTVSKHLVPIMAKLNPQFSLSLVERIVEYARDPEEDQRFNVLRAFPSMTATSSTTAPPRLRVMVFYSKARAGRDPPLLDRFLEGVKGVATRIGGNGNGLAVELIEVVDGESATNDSRGTATFKPQGVISSSLVMKAKDLTFFGLHRNDGQVWHMCIVDEAGVVLRNSWPQARVVDLVARDRIK